MGKIDSTLVADLAKAARVPDLSAKCAALRTVAFACDRQATRLEGCRCHAFLLHRSQGGTWAERVRKYRAASNNCVWKGRAAVEMALGHGDKVVELISRASDGTLRQRRPQQLQNSDRGWCILKTH